MPTREGISLPVEKYSELLEGVKALGDVMGSDKVVAKIKKTDNNEIWIGFNTYKKIALIYLRTYAGYGDNPELRPTKQGISLRVEQYPHLLEAVEKLGEAITHISKE